MRKLFQSLIYGGLAVMSANAFRLFRGRIGEQFGVGDRPVVMITGGSRGLGLAMAMEWARRGARLALCARDAQELALARDKIEQLQLQTEVFTHVCDLTDPAQIERFVGDTLKHFERVDVLINNAGIIEVGPIDTLGEKQFKSAMDTNLWSMIRTSLALLPHLKSGSRIVNITSIGGAVAVPHLLAYSVSKFGAVGFSLGLDAELAKRKISVTTVLPGLMRTGSFVHALFRGQATKEFDWFALGASLPGVSISAEKAARQVVKATLRRERFIVLGPQAKIMRLGYQVFPRFALAVVRGVARFLPDAQGTADQDSIPGKNLRRDLPSGGVTRVGDVAGDRLNENAA